MLQRKDIQNNFSRFAARKAAIKQMQDSEVPAPKRFASSEWHTNRDGDSLVPNTNVEEYRKQVQTARDSNVTEQDKARARRLLEINFGEIKGGTKVLDPNFVVTPEHFAKCGIRYEVFQAMQQDSQAQQIKENRQAYRDLTANMSAEELNQLWQATALELIQSQGMDPNFFSWGNGFNWNSFISACRGLNGLVENQVPAADEALKAHNYCLAHHHYFDRPEFKRSEQHLRRQIIGFSMPEPTVYEQEENSYNQPFSDLQEQVRSGYRPSKTDRVY